MRDEQLSLQPRGVPVPAGPAIRQREVDHRAQQYRRGEGILAGENFGGRRQDLVVIAIQLVRAFENEIRRPVEGGSRDKKIQRVGRFGDCRA